MHTFALGQMRVTKGEHLDIVLFVPGKGRVMTYNHMSKTAYIHSSSMERALVRLIEAQYDTTRLPSVVGKMFTTSSPSSSKAVAPVTTTFHVPPLTIMQIIRTTFLSVVGYENVSLDSSFIARNYILARSLMPSADGHDYMARMRLERNATIDANKDKGIEAMSYFVYSGVEMGDVNHVVAYSGSQNILVSAGRENLYASRMSALHLKHSVGGKNIGDVLRDIGNIRGFDWDTTRPLRKGQLDMAKELIWRFYAERSPVIGGNPIPEGRNIFYTSTTIEGL